MTSMNRTTDRFHLPITLLLIALGLAPRNADAQLRYEFSGRLNLQSGPNDLGFDSDRFAAEITFVNPVEPSTTSPDRTDFNDVIGMLDFDSVSLDVDSAFSIFRFEPTLDVSDMGYRTPLGDFIFSLRFDQGGNDDLPIVPSYSGFPVASSTLLVTTAAGNTVFSIDDTQLNVVPATLFWSGASETDNLDFADVGNWVDSTGRRSVIVPSSGIDVVLDENSLDGAEIGGWPSGCCTDDRPGEHVLFNVPNDRENAVGSLLISGQGFEPSSLPANSANLLVHGPVEIRNGGRLYVNDGLTIDLRPAGDHGDVFVRSDAASIGLTLQQGDLFADEVFVETNDEERTLTMLNGSNLTARRLEVDSGADVSLSSGATAVIDEPMSLGGELSIFSAAITTPTLTVQPTGQLFGNQSRRPEPIIDANLTNLGELAPGSNVDLSSLYRFRPGLMVVDGDFEQTDEGALLIDLNSTSPASIVDPLIATAHDLLIVEGSASIGGMLEIEIGPDLVLEPGMQFDFLEIAGDRLGEFADLPEGDIAYSDPASNLSLAITYMAGDGNDIGLIAVPEPSGVTLLLVGLLLLLPLHLSGR